MRHPSSNDAESKAFKKGKYVKKVVKAEWKEIAVEPEFRCSFACPYCKRTIGSDDYDFLQIYEGETISKTFICVKCEKKFTLKIPGV